MPVTTGVFEIDWDLDCNADYTFDARGLLVIETDDSRDDSRRYPGLRDLDGHQDVFDAEIVRMSLEGEVPLPTLTVTVGEALGNGGILPASFGAGAESEGDSFAAESFFDVYAEIGVDDPNGIILLYNMDPLRFSAVIDRVPPNGVTFSVAPRLLSTPQRDGRTDGQSDPRGVYGQPGGSYPRCSDVGNRAADGPLAGRGIVGRCAEKRNRTGRCMIRLAYFELCNQVLALAKGRRR